MTYTPDVSKMTAATNGVNGHATVNGHASNGASTGQPLDLTVLGMNSGTSMVSPIHCMSAAFN